MINQVGEGKAEVEEEATFEAAVDLRVGVVDFGEDGEVVEEAVKVEKETFVNLHLEIQ